MIIGHSRITDFLSQSIKNDRIAHAYLFIGPEHVGKRTVAIEFVKALQCQKSGLSARNPSSDLTQPTLQVVGRAASRLSKPHFVDDVGGADNLGGCGECISCQEIDKNTQPDVLIVEPESIANNEKKTIKEISIGQVRNLQHQINLFPFRGPYKIILIDQAEKISRPAANALLKTLEEPPKNTILILISSDSRYLLPTIISRCLLIKFSLVDIKIINGALRSRNDSSADVQKIAKIACGKPGIALEYISNPRLISEQSELIHDLEKLAKKDISALFGYAETLAKDIDLAQQKLSQWILFYRDLILRKVGCDDIVIWNSGEIIKAEILEKKKAGELKDFLLKIIQTKEILNNSSFNARLALEVLMLNL